MNANRSPDESLSRRFKSKRNIRCRNGTENEILRGRLTVGHETLDLGMMVRFHPPQSRIFNERVDRVNVDTYRRSDYKNSASRGVFDEGQNESEMVPSTANV